MTGGWTTADLAAARGIADSVLYEGYVLFPYRASARKNRFRWQLGVVVPADQAEATDAGEPCELVSECLLHAAPAVPSKRPRVGVTARFLHLRRREVRRRGAGGAWERVEQLDVGGRLVPAWDESVEREVHTGEVHVADLLQRGHEVAFAFPGHRDVEQVREGGRVHGEVVRSMQPLEGSLGVGARVGDQGTVTLRLTVRNSTAWCDRAAPRDEVMRHSLIGVHLLVTARDASLLSLLDPPQWARRDAAAVRNHQAYPVLVGAPESADVVLCSPVILDDHPQLAAQSPGHSYDATEIDELLTLTVRALTDDEKREARATDGRAAEVIDRAERMEPDALARLHGVMRSVGRPTAAATSRLPTAPSDDLAAFLGEGEPPRGEVRVGTQVVRIGSTVRLRPTRRADAQDLFATDRLARVERIVDDVDGSTWLGVTLHDDPGADLHAWYGRFMYFRPDEIEPSSDEEGV